MQTQIRAEVLPDLDSVPSIRTNKINISISETSPLKMFECLGSAKNEINCVVSDKPSGKVREK